MTRRSLWILTAIAAAGCRASFPAAPTSFPAFGLATAQVTDAYEYRHAPDDTIGVQWQEAYHRWAVGALEVPAPRRIRFNKYKSREHMGTLIGVGDTNGFANGETFEIHTIWPTDNHEVVHLYSSAFGRTVALWSEGLAVAFQTDPPAGDFVPRWSGIPLDDRVRRFRADGRFIPVAELLTTAGFRRFDPNVTYPQAGSFVRDLLDTCGLNGVKQLFATGNTGDAALQVAAKFEAACGTTVAAAEHAWLTRLEAR